MARWPVKTTVAPVQHVAVGGLLVFAEVGLGEAFVDVGEFVVAEEQAGEDDGEFASAAVAAEAFPAGMRRF